MRQHRLPKGWRRVAVGDCCEIVSGATPRRDHPEYWGGDIAWVTPKDLTGLDKPVLDETPEKITHQGLQSCSARRLPAGALLFSSRAPIGHIAVTGREMCTNQGFKSLLPGPDIDVFYLYWCLRHVKPLIVAQGRGSTFKEISKEIMARVEIPVPPFPEQKRIAAILDKADTIRRKRHAAVAKTDDFLRSAFLEMFGDPTANPKGWPVKPLAALVRPDDKINYGVVQPGVDVSGGMPIVRVGDFVQGRIEKDGLKRIDPGIEAKYHRSRLRGDEILIACVGSIGEVALADASLVGFNIVRAVARVPLADGTDREYVFHYLRTRFVQNYFIRETRTVSQPTLNIGHIQETPIAVPDRKAQEAFAGLCHICRAHRTKAFIAETGCEDLFGTLVQRAFLGEL